MSHREKDVVLLDGGFSTQLVCNSKEKVEGNPLWTAHFLLTNTEAVIKTHLDYLRAGAEVVITNTYQASVGGFEKYLKLNEKESHDLIKSAVKLTKEAVSIYLEEEEDKSDIRKILIAGSVGPYGASLHDGSEYRGEYINEVSEEELVQWHLPKINCLVEAGVDLLAFETIPAQKEAVVLLELLKEFPQMKAWVSFTCKDESHTSFGEKFEDVVCKCWSINPSQTIAVGINCSDPKFVTSLICNINTNRPDDKIPLIVYPNRGEHYDAKTGWCEAEKCKPLADYAAEWLNLGVCYIGGCCRINASDIAELKTAVKKWKLERKVKELLKP